MTYRRPEPFALVDRLTALGLAGLMAGAMFGIPTAIGMSAPGRPELPASAAGLGQQESIKDAPIVDEDPTQSGAIGRAADGLFYAEVKINGNAVRCLIDSGASGLMLDVAKARDLGITDPLEFAGRVTTAGGVRRAARIKLRTFELAGRELRDISAILIPGSGAPCLVGQDVLSRLDAVEIHGDRLTLR